MNNRRILTGCPNVKVLPILHVQTDDLIFCENGMSISHEKFSEVREKSGKSQEK